MRLGHNSLNKLINLIPKFEITSLNLADNAISDQGMLSIKNIIDNTNIKHLNLASNMISSEGLDIIVENLSEN